MNKNGKMRRMTIKIGKEFEPHKIAKALENLIKIDDEQVTSATWEEHGKRWDKTKKKAVQSLKAYKERR